MIEVLPVDNIADHERKERDVTDAVRLAVLERDNHQCQSCGNGGENHLQLHHVVYRSQGGSHLEDNLVVLCVDCHRDLHAGFLKVAFIEWRPGDYSWFCSRKKLPRRWYRTSTGNKS